MDIHNVNKIFEESARKTKRDRNRNQTIRMGLGMAPLAYTIETKRLQWFGHLESHRIPKMAWQARTQGKTPKGRP